MPASKLIPVNGNIACEPPASTQVEIKVQGGFGRVSQKTQLTGLKVVFGNENLPEMPKVLAPTGSTVYLNGEQVAAHQWSKKVYEHEGVKFILVPESVVLMVAPPGAGGEIKATGLQIPDGLAPAQDGPMIREVP